MNKKNKNKKNKTKNKNVDNNNIINIICFAITIATSYSNLVINFYREIKSCINREDITLFIVFNISTLSILKNLTSSNEKIPIDSINIFNFSSSLTIRFVNVSRLYKDNLVILSSIELILDFDIFAYFIINRDLI